MYIILVFICLEELFFFILTTRIYIGTIHLSVNVGTVYSSTGCYNIPT